MRLLQRFPLVWRSTLEAVVAKHTQVLADNELVHKDEFVKFVGKLKSDYDRQVAERDRKIEKLTERNDRLQDALCVKVLKGAG